MAPRKIAAIPAAARKTLLEWIEFDDGNTTDKPQPTCSPKEQALHAQIVAHGGRHGDDSERLQPPQGLRLAPLG